MKDYFMSSHRLQDAANDLIHAHAVWSFCQRTAEGREGFAIESLRAAAALLGFDLVERSTVINESMEAQEPDKASYVIPPIAGATLSTVVPAPQGQTS